MCIHRFFDEEKKQISIWKNKCCKKKGNYSIHTIIVITKPINLNKQKKVFKPKTEFKEMQCLHMGVQ